MAHMMSLLLWAGFKIEDYGDASNDYIFDVGRNEDDKRIAIM